MLEGWMKRADYFYLITDNYVIHDEAQNSCLAYGADMLSVTSASESNFIDSKIG